MQTFHSIVLGVGGMGAAAAFHLARRGVPVLGLEQFDIPHAFGSSHGQSRLIRLAYYEHPDYVPLLRSAYALWELLEQVTGERVLHKTGGVYLGPPESELLTGSLASARSHGLPHELLTAQALAARFPQFQLPAHFAAFYEPDAGVLLPEKAVAAHAMGALQKGAVLHAQEPAMEWSADSGGVTVRTTKDTYRAERLVITAGPWSARPLPFLESRITVTRQPMLWFWPKRPEQFMEGVFPAWCIASDAGGLIYGPPRLQGENAPLGLKVAHHFPGQVTTAETVVRDPLPQDADVVRTTLAAHLPDANGPLLSQRVCLYSNSTDHHFLLDQHPDHSNVFFAGGFSGHGFKFASVIGEILADLATTGRTAHPIDFLRLSRLERN